MIFVTGGGGLDPLATHPTPGDIPFKIFASEPNLEGPDTGGVCFGIKDKPF